MQCTKAIVLVAGFGTRRLPVAKAIEKCMLPVLNRPIVDYVVEDCIKAGIKEIFFVISEGQTQIKQFYSRQPALEQHLRDHKKEHLLPLALPTQDCTFHYIEQPAGKYGTTVPVWLARDVIKEGEKVLVVSGDQFYFNEDGSSEARQFF